jgi:catechol 2,3-dioxygenase-like lactoylglutathione lyase family enzyme
MRARLETDPPQPRNPKGRKGKSDGLQTGGDRYSVSDVDVSKAFYSDVVGFAVDHDISPGPGTRVVQLTPPGSLCSIVIGEGMPLGEPGTTKGAQLVVDDIDAAREELVGRGLQITEVQQLGPEGAPGSRFAFFADPDGNGWSTQEFKR